MSLSASRSPRQNELQLILARLEDLQLGVEENRKAIASRARQKKQEGNWDLSDDEMAEDQAPTETAILLYKAWRKNKKAGYKNKKLKFKVGEYAFALEEEGDDSLWNTWRDGFKEKPPLWSSLKKTYIGFYALQKMKEDI